MNLPKKKSPVRLSVLGSGKGSNCRTILSAICAGQLDAEIALIVSDQPDAGISDIAREASIPFLSFPETRYRTRLSEEQESRLVAALYNHGIEIVVLAGYMRVIKAPLLSAFPGRIVNIHPSLLPQFPGLAAWKQAIDAGATVSGCTVHFVDEGIDSGEILGQETVPVLPGDTAESLHARIQIAEHHLFPTILQRLCSALRPNE